MSVCFQCGSSELYIIYADTYSCNTCGAETHIESELNKTDKEITMPEFSSRIILQASGKVKNGYYLNKRINIWESSTYPERRSDKAFKYMMKMCSESKYKNIVRKPVISISLQKYNIIINRKKTRIPKTIGILAKCIQYSLRDYNLLIPDTWVCQIFKIDKKILKKAEDTIKAVYKKYIDIRNALNRSPLKLSDFIESIEYYFPKLSRSDIDAIKKIIIRLNKNRIYMNNVPKSTITGLLIAYVSKYGIPIPKERIESVFNVSRSTATKYADIIKTHFI